MCDIADRLDEGVLRVPYEGLLTLNVMSITNDNMDRPVE